MKIFVERKNENLAFEFSGTVKALLSKIGVNPEEVLVVRGGELITLDDAVSNDDELRLLSVISGG